MASLPERGAAMGHSTVDLTMSVYTAPRLLDVAGALDVLPELPIIQPPAALPVITTTR